MTISEIVILCIAVLIMIFNSVIIFLNLKKNNKTTTSSDFGMEMISLRKEMKNYFDNESELFKSINQMQTNSLKMYNDNVVNYLSQNTLMERENLSEIQKRLADILKSNEERLEKASDILEKGLAKISGDNEKKLEEMRLTVDEKLNVSLERRLSESFNLISSRLESVYRGLGEMQTLASGVGDLKKVLTNVKTRGVWGEISLGNLLEQIMTHEQFEKNVAIKKDSLERVDFAIKLPGKDEEEILLPIDAKFPMEDYQRLCEASENGNSADVELAIKSLEKRIKEEAKSIKEKYISLPKTTDFAMMYLATEGLYAEVARRAGLMEFLQENYKVVICGPTTLSAMLNSLQLGFKTLSIEKRSSEIWTLLGIFKNEFEKFTMLLSKTQKKLIEATNTIDMASKKTKTIARKLKNVSSLVESDPFEEALLEEDVADLKETLDEE